VISNRCQDVVSVTCVGPARYMAQALSTVANETLRVPLATLAQA
jgi:hypothetical protein